MKPLKAIDKSEYAHLPDEFAFYGFAVHGSTGVDIAIGGNRGAEKT